MVQLSFSQFSVNSAPRRAHYIWYAIYSHLHIGTYDTHRSKHTHTLTHRVGMYVCVCKYMVCVWPSLFGSCFCVIKVTAKTIRFADRKKNSLHTIIRQCMRELCARFNLYPDSSKLMSHSTLSIRRKSKLLFDRFVSRIAHSSFDLRFSWIHTRTHTHTWCFSFEFQIR